MSIIIVGAGLSGLLTATHLHTAGHKPIIIEARNRIGGRILSVAPQSEASASSNFKFDLGPTWVWPHHQRILNLLRTLNLEIYPQYEAGAGIYEQTTSAPPRAFKPDWQQPTSYRVIGGIGAITNRLASQLPKNTIQLDRTVQSVHLIDQQVAVTAHNNKQDAAAVTVYRADHVVITLPPHLAATTVDYQPALPSDLMQVMTTTPTWMGMAMKVVLQYAKPFWRERDLSGLGISYAGPVAQFHDASPHDQSLGALFGWIGDNHPSRQLSITDRKTAVISQAVRMFGEEADYPVFYDELNWSQETMTTNLVNNPIATEHPRYGHALLQAPQMGGRVHWAVTEASSIEGGYLDGCVVIAKQVSDKIIAATA